jgi:prepilin-type N-terminal cleavage/methylation domain-containing protein
MRVHDSRRIACASAQGFTLFEIVIALSIGGIVLLAARQLLTELADGATRVGHHSMLGDREANGERLLRELFARLEVSPDSGRAFGGDPSRVSFSSWCDTPDGWQERCAVVVASGGSGTAHMLTAALPNGGTISLLTRESAVTIAYLRDPGNGGVWLDRWPDGISAPVAIGIVAGSDTMLVRIGERG